MSEPKSEAAPELLSSCPWCKAVPTERLDDPVATADGSRFWDIQHEADCFLAVDGSFSVMDVEEIERWNARVSANNEREGWQSIGTAPKDGTRILVLRENGRISEARWLPAHDGGNWWYGLATLNPTHWMKLPEPPKQ